MSRSRSLIAISLLVTGLAVFPARGQELTARQMETIWADFIGNDEEGAKKALVGIVALSKSPKAAVPFLKERIKPVPPVETQKISQTIAELDSSNFQTREAAAKTLELLGPLAAPTMEKKLQENISLEVRQAIEGLLRRIDDRAITAPELQAVRGIEVLEAIGTPEARAVLESLAKGGTGAIVTDRAAAGLERLRRRTAGK
jgi:HEAT repeat protein